MSFVCQCGPTREDRLFGLIYVDLFDQTHKRRPNAIGEGAKKRVFVQHRDGAGDHAFTRATFPEDEDRSLGIGGAEEDVELALEAGLPVVLHVRRAAGAVLQVQEAGGEVAREVGLQRP